MLAALRREPMIDHARVTLIGHSEGAVVATRLAAADRRVAGLVLLAGPGRPIDVVLLEQVALTLQRAGLTAEEIDEALARHRAAFAAIRAGQPLPETAEAREWAGGEAWLRSHLRHDLAATTGAIRRVAVYIAQGALDQQVTVADGEALFDAFFGRGNRVTLAQFPSLNHNFVASATGDVSEYVDPGREIDADFVADVVEFVRHVP
jgi:pimeloyl-ACP methyl ester carboxylesterase